MTDAYTSRNKAFARDETTGWRKDQAFLPLVYNAIVFTCC